MCVKWGFPPRWRIYTLLLLLDMRISCWPCLCKKADNFLCLASRWSRKKTPALNRYSEWKTAHKWGTWLKDTEKSLPVSFYPLDQHRLCTFLELFSKCCSKDCLFSFYSLARIGDKFSISSLWWWNNYGLHLRNIGRKSPHKLTLECMAMPSLLHRWQSLHCGVSILLFVHSHLL